MMKLKKSITASSYFPSYGIVRGLKYIREDGYDAIDYGLENYNSIVYEAVERDACSWADNLLYSVKTAGLYVCQTHGPWRWPPKDTTEEDRAYVLAKAKRAIIITHILEAPYMVMHPIMPFGDYQDLDNKVTHDVNIKFFTDLADYAQKYQVTVCIENVPMPGLSIASVQSVVKFLDEIQHPSLQACLDTGHALITMENPAECVNLLGERLKCLHLHDNHGERDEHLWPGDGIINWNELYLALSKIGYQGVLSLETGVVDKAYEREKRIIQEQNLFRRL